MERIAKILMIAGLVLILCAPAIAAAQAPVKFAPCGVAPRYIDGIHEEAWDSAHWEDITLDFGMSNGVSALQPPYGIDLATMVVGNTLYVGLAEYWELNFVEDGFYSLFCMGFEDDDPPWAWNGDEGWLCFVGLAELPPHPVQDEWNWEWYSEESVAFYIQRIGGWQDKFPGDCFGEFAIHTEGMPPDHPGFLPGLRHGFGYGIAWPTNELEVTPSQPPQAYVQFHEIAIDLSVSPLNLGDFQNSFRGWFGAFAMGPDVVSDDGTGELDYRAIAEEIATLLHGDFPPDPYVHLMGFWPGGRGSGPDPEDQLAFLGCLADHYGGNGADLTCDLGLPCFGEIEVCGREFVPEPGTLLLLGGGLMGLGGYVRLRLRKR